MKMSPVFTLFSSLALCCCFLGVASKGPEEDECSEFFQSSKGKPFACTDDYNPVCGTDNETYSNKCMLCAARRETGKDIDVKHKGECEKKDECSRIRKPVKGQATVCIVVYNPVCGSDGVTYGNLCKFCIAKRESGGKLTIKHEDQCEKKDECSRFPEPVKGQETVCTLVYNPVCGSDGVTYGNLCKFCIAKRQSGGKLTIKHEDQCEKKDECSRFPEPVKGQETVCTLVYNPVCGSDGVTYGNLCKFCIAKRQSGGKLTIKHEDQCEKKDECSRIRKPVKGQATVCIVVYNPVCGSDGVTYGNLCKFCIAKRESGGKLTIKHEDQCEKKDECSRFPEPVKGQETACTLEYKPVCGSDGMTYGNLCEFCVAKRRSGGKLTIKHEGPCEKKDESSRNPEPSKGEPFKCPADYTPLCGSDGKTHRNMCIFWAARRKSGGKLTIKHEGPCEEQENPKDQ